MQILTLSKSLAKKLVLYFGTLIMYTKAHNNLIILSKVIVSIDNDDDDRQTDIIENTIFVIVKIC